MIITENCKDTASLYFEPFTCYPLSCNDGCENSATLSPAGSNPPIVYSETVDVKIISPGNFISFTTDGTEPYYPFNHTNTSIMQLDTAKITLTDTTTIKYAIIDDAENQILCVDSVTYYVDDENPAPFMSYFPTNFSVDILPSVLSTHQLYMKLGCVVDVVLEVEMYNLNGQKIISTTLPQLKAGWQYQTVDIPSNYPSGIYWVKVNLGEKRFINKVLIVK
jgi:hypothetical protein